MSIHSNVVIFQSYILAMFVSGGFGAQLINFATLYEIFELHFLINKTSIFYNYSINVRFILN